jgi:ATP-dependent DNA helicase RecG
MIRHRPTDAELKVLLDKVSAQPSSELESEHVEFKGYATEQALHNAKDLVDELSALANFEGGYILVGVKAETDVPHGQWNSQLAGTDKMDELTLKERLRGRLRPSVDLHVRNVSIDGVNFVAIGIAHPTDTLVSTSNGKYYIRDGRSSRPMSPDELLRSVKGLVTYDWSSDVVNATTKEALDPLSIDQARADFCARRQMSKIPDHSAFLEAIGATTNGKLVRGGLMFLGKEDAIRAELGDHEYRFVSKSRTGELHLNDVWAGCIWQAVQRAKRHFSACNNVATFTFRGEQFQAPLLDDSAFHEAYLNALVHRDYSTPGMVSVTFTGDLLSVSSPGGFYGGVTADNIVLHEPRHRNRTLAKILMSFHLVDRAGMGVLRMGLGSLRYGRSFPKFSEANSTVEVVLEAEHLKPGIAALALSHQNDYGIGELLVLNSVYQTGAINVDQILSRMDRWADAPWKETLRAVEQLAGIVEFSGSQSGLHVAVRDEWSRYMNVGKKFHSSKNSARHVALYKYLRQHTLASNSDLRTVLGYTHSSQTSSFLKSAKYVRRTGSGPSARWSLVSKP